MRTPLLFLLAVTTFGCTREIPPPAAPTVTSSDEVPLTESEKRTLTKEDAEFGVVFITTDVPARVERRMGMGDRGLVIRGHYSLQHSGVTRSHSPFSSQVICPRTPCKVLLPYGTHMLEFRGLDDDGRQSVAWVTTHEPRVDVNHTLGQHRSSVGVVVGAAMIVAGVIAIAFPFGVDMDRDKPTPKVLWGAGIGAIAGGVAVMSFFPGISQQGATGEDHGPPKLPPQPAMQSKGVSLGWQF